MNLNISLTNNELFFQAINHPDTVEEDIILALIEKYPYAQSLRFVYERKVFGKHGLLLCSMHPLQVGYMNLFIVNPW